MHDRNTNTLLIVLAIVLVIFVAGRFLGGALFDNSWSFVHWQYLPAWFGFAWIGALVALTAALFALRARLISLAGTRRGMATGLSLLGLLFITCHFDSFVFGGGNLRIAQIAQSERVIYRWYEGGSLMLTDGLYHLYRLLGLKANDAGWFAWATLAYAAVFATLIALYRLATELTSDRSRRILLMILMFFGSQALLGLGFVGPEVVVASIVSWFFLYTLKVERLRDTKSTLILWGIVAVGVFLHVSLLFLVPAALFVSLSSGTRRHGAKPAIAAAALGFVVLAAAVVYIAGHSLEFGRVLLMMSGKNPVVDYSLFSPRHLGDFAQILFLAAPLAAVAVAMAFRQKRTSDLRTTLAAGWLALAGGLGVIFVVDPVNGIVLDFPRLLGYVAPCSFLLAFYVSGVNDPAVESYRFRALLVAAAVMLPLAIVPNYVWIRQSENYVSSYLEKHDTYYGRACLAYRDAYFARGEYSSADRWEWKIPVKSPDLLNLRGTVTLAGNGEDEEALKVLYQIIAKNPYWDEPRGVVAGIQMKMMRYKLAKPQIDTCLMLEPYKKEYHVHLYAYYRDIGDLSAALREVTCADSLFPGDKEIQTDVMLLQFRTGDVGAAEWLAETLLARDSSLAFPHLVKGLMAERKSDIPTALQQMKRFVELAPNEPETPTIREKIVNLEKGPTGK